MSLTMPLSMSLSNYAINYAISLFDLICSIALYFDYLQYLGKLSKMEY